MNNEHYWGAVADRIAAEEDEQAVKSILDTYTAAEHAELRSVIQIRINKHLSLLERLHSTETSMSVDSKTSDSADAAMAEKNAPIPKRAVKKAPVKWRNPPWDTAKKVAGKKAASKKAAKKTAEKTVASPNRVVKKAPVKWRNPTASVKKAPAKKARRS